MQVGLVLAQFLDHRGVENFAERVDLSGLLRLLQPSLRLNLLRMDGDHLLAQAGDLLLNQADLTAVGDACVNLSLLQLPIGVDDLIPDFRNALGQPFVRLSAGEQLGV